MLIEFSEQPLAMPQPALSPSALASTPYDSVALARELIRCRSVTPEEAGCYALLMPSLARLGMNCQRWDDNGVSNLFASFNNGKPLLAFVGHIDVVPAGERSDWHCDPFAGEIRDGRLIGRGAADMKGAVAAMVVAIQRFHSEVEQKHIDVAMVLTSDEEGDAIYGVQHVVQQLHARGQHVDWALVGEPSSEAQVGDSIKIGRRGSLTGRVVLHGKSGHVGYPKQIVNPLKAAAKFLDKIQKKSWDLPSRYFPATSLQVVKCHAGGAAENVSPDQLALTFNLRYSPKQTVAKISKYITKQLDKTGLDYDIQWQLDAEPFITRRSQIRTVVEQTVLQRLGRKPKLSTSGGTSDGRFFAKNGTQVVELGLCNRLIHQANESVAVADIELLTQMYFDILMKMNQLLARR